MHMYVCDGVHTIDTIGAEKSTAVLSTVLENRHPGDGIPIPTTTINTEAVTGIID